MRWNFLRRSAISALKDMDSRHNPGSNPNAPAVIDALRPFVLATVCGTDASPKQEHVRQLG